LPEHVLRHIVVDVLHAYLWQFVVVEEQEPAPSQWPAVMAWLPSQRALEQTVVLPYFRHPPAPSHAPSVPQEVIG
jgi:hypothetical protein